MAKKWHYTNKGTGAISLYGDGITDFWEMLADDNEMREFQNFLGMFQDPFRVRAEFFQKLEEMVRGKDVVEIGPGQNPLRSLFEFDPRSYTCVEVTGTPADDLPRVVRYEEDDGLSYLQGINSPVSVVSISRS